MPNQNQCKECHSLSGRIAPIGVKARNLNGDFAYPEGTENQLAHWTRTGPADRRAGAGQSAAHRGLGRPPEPLEARARAYLDGNCGHCHNPHGMASNTGLFLDLEERAPPARHRQAPGRRRQGLRRPGGRPRPRPPDASIIAYRMASTDPGVMMPELGRSLVHDEGLALVRDYIAKMRKP